MSLFGFVALFVLYSFAIISLGKRGLAALLVLRSECHVYVGLWCVIVAIPSHTNLRLIQCGLVNGLATVNA